MLFESNEEMFTYVLQMFKSYNTNDKLFKCSMTDEGDLKVDFFTRKIFKKDFPICVFLKKVESSKQTDLINICVKILQKRIAKQLRKG
jgi:hypothetical protein